MHSERMQCGGVVPRDLGACPPKVGLCTALPRDPSVAESCPGVTDCLKRPRTSCSLLMEVVRCCPNPPRIMGLSFPSVVTAYYEVAVTCGPRVHTKLASARHPLPSKSIWWQWNTDLSREWLCGNLGPQQRNPWEFLFREA
jgi:hypothetical protein